MGTHPIFESDFDCLTEMVKEKYERGEKKMESKRETWDTLKDEGNKFFSHRKYEQALKSYSRAIQKAPTNDVLFTNRALCRIKMKKFDEAAGDAREAVQHCPNSVKGHYLLGQALLHLERFDDALASLQTAQRYATEQRKNFGEEIAQSIRLAKKRRWEAAEQKRIKQEIDLETYLINLIQNDRNRQLDAIDEPDEEDQDRSKKAAETECDKRVAEVKSMFSEMDARRKRREVPDYLCDKISFDLLKDPVITPSGITYNRKDIEEHLQKVGHFDPVSSKKLTSSMLVPNLVMKEVVTTFIEDNEWAEDY